MATKKATTKRQRSNEENPDLMTLLSIEATTSPKPTKLVPDVNFFADQNLIQTNQEFALINHATAGWQSYQQTARAVSTIRKQLAAGTVEIEDHSWH
jgi:hypothetical protein